MHRTWTARENAWAYGIPPTLVGMKHVVEANARFRTAHEAIGLGSNAFMKTAFFAMLLQSACAGFHVPSPLLFNDEASLHRGWGGGIFEGRSWMTRDVLLVIHSTVATPDHRS